MFFEDQDEDSKTVAETACQELVNMIESVCNRENLFRMTAYSSTI
jgi:hypothetical protein